MYYDMAYPRIIKERAPDHCIILEKKTHFNSTEKYSTYYPLVMMK
jgi:hypothetical protein